jgi:hypothetical protein
MKAMSVPPVGPWWRGLIPRQRRREGAAVIRLADGSAVPASFAAAILGQRERAGIEARRRSSRSGLPAPGPLGRAAWAGGLRPSVDSIGPRAEVLLRLWTAEVDREPPEIVGALEGEDRAAFLLRGWVTPRTFPRARLRSPDGTVVAFRALRGLEPRGLAGGSALVAASVAGPLVPRLRPSPAVAADGLLVPVRPGGVPVSPPDRCSPLRFGGSVPGTPRRPRCLRPDAVGSRGVPGGGQREPAAHPGPRGGRGAP